MKTRLGFVSNSSSCSYLCIIPKSLEKKYKQTDVILENFKDMFIESLGRYNAFDNYEVRIELIKIIDVIEEAFKNGNVLLIDVADRDNYEYEPPGKVIMKIHE